MKPPIIIDEHGDVSAFKTPEHVEQYLEAIDVRNNEYVAYDCDGKLLVLRVGRTNEHVSIEARHPEVDHSEELRRVLINSLQPTGEQEQKLTSMSLSELVAYFVAAHGYTR